MAGKSVDSQFCATRFTLSPHQSSLLMTQIYTHLSGASFTIKMLQQAVYSKVTSRACIKLCITRPYANIFQNQCCPKREGRKSVEPLSTCYSAENDRKDNIATYSILHIFCSRCCYTGLFERLTCSSKHPPPRHRNMGLNTEFKPQPPEWFSEQV